MITPNDKCKQLNSASRAASRVELHQTPVIVIKYIFIYRCRTVVLFASLSTCRTTKDCSIYTTTMSDQKYVVIGAGPVGALAALYAAHRGHQVEVYELRGGMYMFFSSPSRILGISECPLESLHGIRCLCFPTSIYLYPARSSRPKHGSLELHQVYQPCTFRTRYSRAEGCWTPRSFGSSAGGDASDARSYDPRIQVRRTIRGVTAVRCKGQSTSLSRHLTRRS